MTDAPFHRITRTEVDLDIVRTEKDTLVVCHCPYCDDFIIGAVVPDKMHPWDGPIIKTKTECDHFEFFNPGYFMVDERKTNGELKVNKAIFSQPAQF